MCFKRVKEKKARERKRGTWGQGKRRETEEEKAANILSPQMYGVLSDVHMPKTLIHSYKHTYARAHSHTHPCTATATLPEGGRGGGSMGGSHFKLAKRGRGLSWQTGCILALNHIIRRKTENKQHARINSVKAAFAALRLLLSKWVNPVHW